MRERERERERETETETETETDRQTDRQTDRETERERERQRDHRNLRNDQLQGEERDMVEVSSYSVIICYDCSVSFA